MPLTITQQLGRCPTFAELQALAGQHDVRINGNESAGEFYHPNSNQPKVTGHYAFEPNGDIRGDFAGHFMGKLSGFFTLTNGKAEVTVSEKPFLLPEALLKSTLSLALKDFCDKFTTDK